MKLLLPSLLGLVLVGVFVALMPSPQLSQAQALEPKQLFDSAENGIWVITTIGGGAGHPIRNPRIVNIADSAFITGTRVGKIETYQDTVFNGGVASFQLIYVVSIQQLPEKK